MRRAVCAHRGGRAIVATFGSATFSFAGSRAGLDGCSHAHSYPQFYLPHEAYPVPDTESEQAGRDIREEFKGPCRVQTLGFKAALPEITT
jgi:hypothetical protein